MQNLKKIAAIKDKYGNGKYKGKYILKFDYITSYKIIFSWYKVEKLDKNFSRTKISKIPGIWRHFQELAKFLEKFLERPPVNLCSPDTKSNFRSKISVDRKFRKFQEFDVTSKNFGNSKNLTSFPRIGEKFLERPPTNLCSPNTKSNFRLKISVDRKFRKFQEFDVISKNWRNSWKNFSNDLLPTYVLLIQNPNFG